MVVVDDSILESARVRPPSMGPRGTSFQPTSPPQWVWGILRTMRRASLLAIVMASACLGTTAQAQRSIDIGRFRPALDHEGFLGMNGTATPGPWRWNVGLWLDYAKRPLTATTDAGTRAAIEHRFAGDLQVQVGLGGRGAIAIDVPLVFHQSTRTDALDDGGPTLQSNVFGDPRLSVRARVFGRDARVQRQRREGPGLSLLAAMTVPSSGDESFAGEGQVTFDLQATVDFHVFGAGAGLMLGWRARPHERRVGGTLFRDQLLFGVALKVPIPVANDLAALLEVRGALDARDPFGGGPRQAIEGNLGFRYRHNHITYTVGVGTGFTDGVGTPAVRGLFGLQWAPRTKDADGDGLPDDDDSCPHLPEDFDGFEDHDGCMDPDNDNDFVPDVDDRCPNEEALEGYDEDEDGCTDPGAPTAGDPAAPEVGEDAGLPPSDTPASDATGDEPPTRDEPPAENTTNDAAPAHRAPQDAPTSDTPASP